MLPAAPAASASPRSPYTYSGTSIGNDVGLVTRRQTADVAEPERPRPAARRVPQQCLRADAGADRQRRVVGRGHDLTQREAAPGAHVGAEPDAHAPADRRLQRHAAAAEEEIAVRAMCDRGAARRHAVPCPFGQMDAMGEQRARPAQTVVLVYRQIIVAVRERLRRGGDLVGVLGEVGLHRQAVALGQRRRAAQQLRRAAEGEARRDTKLQAPAVTPVPALDQRRAGRQRRPGREQQPPSGAPRSINVSPASARRPRRSSSQNSISAAIGWLDE